MPINGKSLVDIVKEKKAAGEIQATEAPQDSVVKPGLIAQTAMNVSNNLVRSDSLGKTFDALKRATSKIKEGIQRGGDRLAQTYLEDSGKPGMEGVEGTFRGAASALGSVAGGVWEAGGSLLADGYKALPENLRKPVETAGKKFLESEDGKAALQVFHQGVEKYEGWKAANPEKAEWFEAAINLVPFAAQPLEQALTRGATRLAKEGVEAVVDATKPLVRATGEALEAGADTIAAAKASKSASQVDDIVRTIVQGEAKDLEPAREALRKLDVQKVESYDDLAKAADDQISSIAEAQRAHIETTDPARRWIIEDFVTGKGKAKANFVNDAIEHLDELYQSTKDLDGQNWLEALKRKEVKEGLDLNDVNNIAQRYGSEFKTKAFDKMGNPRTSVNGQLYENTRKGVKEAVREKLPDDVSREMDSAMSDLYRLKDLSVAQAEKVYAATQKLRKPSIWSKITTGAGMVADVLTLRTASGLAKGLGLLTKESTNLSPIELEKFLSKNLSKLDTLMGKDDAGFANGLIKLLKEASQSMKK